MSETRGLVKEGLQLVDRPLRIRLGLLVIVALALSGLDALGVLLIVPLVDLMNNGGDFDLPLVGSVGPITVLGTVICLFILKSVTMAVLRWWVLGVTMSASSRASANFYARLLEAPLGFYDRRNTADSVRTVLVTIRNFFEQGVIGIANLVAESASVLVLCTILVLQSPRAGVATLIYLLAAMLLYGRLVQRQTTTKATQAEDLTGQAVQQVQESLGALAELQVRETADYLKQPFETTMDGLGQARRSITFAGEFSRYYLEIAFFGAVGILAGVVMVSEPNDSALSKLAVFAVIGFRVLLSLARILAASNRLRIGRAALELVSDDLASISAAAQQGLVDPRPQGVGPARIASSDLCFYYLPEGPEVLSDVSLTIPAGSTVGIVGESGSGKSTLLELLCGLRAPTSGELDRSVVGCVDRRPKIGYVPQSVFTIDSTVLANVTLGYDTSEDDVWRALDTACIGDFVRRLPDGLNARVGEGGTLLSGGQRQRLGLARALLTQPGLLILDEATSALDVDTELAVLANLVEASAGTTVVIATHRPSILSHCDQILTLDSGRITSSPPLLDRTGEVSA